jgi:carbonic anhydrase/acetyltransferase-like protein (isoleucine patch superfamily)
VTFIKGDAVYQQPFVNSAAHVDETALLIGGMIINKGCFIGPCAVIRLDEKNSADPLIIGENTNIQDGAIVHSTTQSIGRNVIVAHQAIVHGAVIEDNVTLYIQAVADGNGSVIGEGSFLHQGSYVGKGIIIAKDRFVDAGVKVLTQKQADALGPVPDEFKRIKEHVLELNAGHVQRHPESLKAD